MSAPVEAAGAPAASLSERLGDRINPLVVKEIRQGLRTRVFWVCFGLMLLACVLLSLMAYADVKDGGYRARGSTYFFTYFVCLGLVHFFVIPYSAYRSLAREREDETWVLLALTGLGPRRILRGKVTSFLAQAALYASAVGPFLLFSYYLNGIDLPTILVVLVLGAAWLVFLTVLGVCAATLADGRLGRAFVHFLLLGVLAARRGAGAGRRVRAQRGRLSADARSRLLLRRRRRAVADAQLRVAAVRGGGGAAVPGDGGLLARAPAGAGGAGAGERGGGGGAVVESVAAARGGGGGRRGRVPAPDVVRALRRLGCGWAGAGAAGRRRGRGACCGRGRCAASGSWCCCIAGWSLFCVLLGWSSGDTQGNWRALIYVTLASAAYPILYFAVAHPGGEDAALGPAEPLRRRCAVLFISLAGLGSVLPPLLALLVDEPADNGLINLLNPIVGLVNFGQYEYSTDQPKMTLALLGFVCGVAALAAFAADRTLVERERRVHAS